MIESQTNQETEGPRRVVLRPNRSLGARELLAVYAVLAFASLLVAALSAWQGNLFAPLFALLELTLLAACLRWVWLRSWRSEEVLVAADRVRVYRRWPGRSIEYSFHPGWVRVHAEMAERRGHPRRVFIGSHGRVLELGRFLSDEERGEAVSLLGGLLEQARADAMTRDAEAKPTMTLASRTL